MALVRWDPWREIEDKCTGCGMCVTSCGRDVFGYDEDKRKALVARPPQCLVGCTSCEAWCRFGAISFPDKQRVRDFIKKNKILVTAKKQLENKWRQK